MKKFQFILFLTFITHCSFAQKTIELSPIADDPISIHYGSPSEDLNFGYSTWNIAHTQVGGLGFGTNIGRTLFLFDFKSLPSNIKIKKITFTQYAFPDQAGPTYLGHENNLPYNNTCVLKAIDETWKPSIVTWNTRPKTKDANKVILKESKSKFQDYKDIDVTSLIQPMIDNPQSNFGFEFSLVTEEITNALIFCSTNYNDQTKHPKLTISYEEKDTVVVVNPPNTNTNNNNTVKNDTICETRENLYIPNSFSPNQDGINDYFTVFSAKELKINYLRVFDRWGNLLFEKNDFFTNDDINGWNGIFRDKEMPIGTYTYDLKVTDANRCVKIIKGSISIWR